MKNKAAIFTLSGLTAIATFALISFAFSWNACVTRGKTFYPSQFSCVDDDFRGQVLIPSVTYMALFALVSLGIGLGLAWFLGRGRRHA
ncbi:MAG: hypothetical protein AAFU65_00225 [Pseudomonadota bacterium]